MYIRPRERRSRRWLWLLLLIVPLGLGFWYFRTHGLDWGILHLPGQQLPTPAPTAISSREHVAIGDRLLAQGQINEAIAEYRLATEMDPSNSPAYARLGRLLTLRGRTAEGLRHAQRAVEIEVSYEAHRLRLGEGESIARRRGGGSRGHGLSDLRQR